MSSSELRPFHLAIPVDDLARCRRFYGETMGCAEGRSSAQWVDFDFFGHQLVIHRVDRRPGLGGRNRVDGEAVPVPHFGVVLTMAGWTQLRDKLVAAGVEFEMEPTVRFAGEVGEQATMSWLIRQGTRWSSRRWRTLGRCFARGDELRGGGAGL